MALDDWSRFRVISVVFREGDTREETRVVREFPMPYSLGFQTMLPVSEYSDALSNVLPRP